MIDQQTLVHAFVENLSDLHSKLDKLCKLLLQEETALADQNYDAIKQIAIEKNQLTAQVEQAERCRLSQCDKLQIEPDKQGIQQWLKAKPVALQQQVSTLWKRISYLGQKCNSQNQINGILVAHLQRHTQDALTILRGAVAGQDSYSQSGNHENETNKQIIAKA